MQERGVKGIAPHKNPWRSGWQITRHMEVWMDMMRKRKGIYGEKMNKIT
jgi:hypothetical protein